MGQQMKRAQRKEPGESGGGWGVLCPEGRWEKRSAAPPAGGAVSHSRGMQQSNRGVPVCPFPTPHPAYRHTHHPQCTLLSYEESGCGGGGILLSSKPLLMHNSCVSSNFGILLQGFENRKKYEESFSKTALHSSSSNLHSFTT